MKKISVTVGICAYNEESTIGALIDSLLLQKESIFSLEEIIVVSDGSTDSTVEIVKNVQDKRVKLVENSIRKGKHAGVQKIFELFNSEYIVLLDADIELRSEYELAKIVEPFTEKQNFSLVSAKVLPTSTATFVQKAIDVSTRPYIKVIESCPNGDHIFACKGVVMALSRNFAKQLHIPSSVQADDTYIYLLCKKKGLRFKYVSNTLIYYTLPATISDHILQNTRFVNAESEMEGIFGSSVRRTFNKKRSVLEAYMIEELFKSPLSSVSIKVINSYCKLRAAIADNAVSKWRQVRSTKANAVIHKKVTVSVGICAYNERNNIQRLLKTVLKQLPIGFALERIVVVSDGSTDDTAEKVKQLNDSRIILLDEPTRQGKSLSTNKIIEVAQSDILLLIDADIFIPNTMFFADFVRKADVWKHGLVAVDTVPLPGRTLQEKAISYGVAIVSFMKKNWKKGNNYLSFKGAFLACSNEFIKKVKLPDIINNDAYLYFSALSLGYTPKYLSELFIQYVSPSTLEDHLKQAKRFEMSEKELTPYFDTPINGFFKIPRVIFIQAALVYFLKNPFLFMTYLFLSIRTKAARNKEQTSKWQTVISTKYYETSL
jgi:glycosyltransferase involved in cell wall biosynthesis